MREDPQRLKSEQLQIFSGRLTRLRKKIISLANYDHRG